jgi:hypothetical protein
MVLNAEIFNAEWSEKIIIRNENEGLKRVKIRLEWLSETTNNLCHHSVCQKILVYYLHNTNQTHYHWDNLFCWCLITNSLSDCDASRQNQRGLSQLITVIYLHEYLFHSISPPPSVHQLNSALYLKGVNWFEWNSTEYWNTVDTANITEVGRVFICRI